MPFAMMMTDADPDTGRRLTDAEIAALTTRIAAAVTSDFRFTYFGTGRVCGAAVAP
jgi:hypothetical protein